MAIARRYPISVTQAHIDRGQKDNCNSCAVALAAFEQLGQSGYMLSCVAVEGDCINLYDNRHNMVASLGIPDTAKQFIEDFDNGEPVQPFDFEATLHVDDQQLLESIPDILAGIDGVYAALRIDFPHVHLIPGHIATAVGKLAISVAYALRE